MRLCSASGGEQASGNCRQVGVPGTSPPERSAMIRVVVVTRRAVRCRWRGELEKQRTVVQENGVIKTVRRTA